MMTAHRHASSCIRDLSDLLISAQNSNESLLTAATAESSPCKPATSITEAFKHDPSVKSSCADSAPAGVKVDVRDKPKNKARGFQPVLKKVTPQAIKKPVRAMRVKV